MHWVIFGMQNRTFDPYLAAIHRTLVPVMSANMAQVVAWRAGSGHQTPAVNMDCQGGHGKTLAVLNSMCLSVCLSVCLTFRRARRLGRRHRRPQCWSELAGQRGGRRRAASRGAGASRGRGLGHTVRQTHAARGLRLRQPRRGSGGEEPGADGLPGPPTGRQGSGRLGHAGW
jgi:hypothetical protein